MQSHKDQFYELATQKLIYQLSTMNLSAKQYETAVKYTTLFRESFKQPYVKQMTFKQNPNDVWDFSYDSAGFCRVSSILFSIIMGIKDWKLMWVSKDTFKEGSHHFLKHTISNQIFDLTYDQFTYCGYEIPYDLGVSATYGISPSDISFKFAKSIGIDILEILKQNSKG